MYQESDGQTSFFGNFLYDQLVPQEHFLRRLAAVVDFTFVNDQCRSFYCVDNGRPCWEPQIIFKMLLLQYLYNLSDNDIENETSDRLSFKWFLGLDVDQAVPDATTLVRFRDRLGPATFARIFNQIVQIAQQHGLVSDQLHLVDATAIRAKVDTWRIKEQHQRQQPGIPLPANYVDTQTKDPEARFGHTSPQELVYGYKGYIQMDQQNEIIVAASVNAANQQEANQLPALIDSAAPPQQVVADKAFDTPQNQAFLAQRQIQSGIIQKRVVSKDKLTGCFRTESTQAAPLRRQLSRIRKRIEHKIAELKRWHRLRQARFWGLAKTKIQMFLTCCAVNVKRIVKLLAEDVAPPGQGYELAP